MPDWISPALVLAGVGMLLLGAGAAMGGAYAELHHYRATRDAVMLVSLASAMVLVAILMLEVAERAWAS